MADIASLYAASGSGGGTSPPIPHSSNNPANLTLASSNPFPRTSPPFPSLITPPIIPSNSLISSASALA